MASVIGLATSLSAMAEIAIIAHPSNTQSLSTDDIKRIYTGKTTRLDNGAEITPLNIASGSVVDTFNEDLLSRSTSQVNAYWSKLIFTGKAKPIQQVNSEAEMINSVSSDPSALGYVDASSVDGNVKVIATIK